MEKQNNFCLQLCREIRKYLKMGWPEKLPEIFTVHNEGTGEEQLY